MEPVLSTALTQDEAALARAIEDLHRRLLADPPLPIGDVRRALDEVAAMALALYGASAPTPAGADEPPSP